MLGQESAVAWAGVWWALVAIEAKSELDPYSSWLSVTSS